MRKIIALLLLLSTFHAFSQEIIDPFTRAALRRTVALMDQSKYDSAHFVIKSTLQNDALDLSAYELYLIKGYEAEIMYYNALFDQGLSTAITTMDLAKQMNNPRFIGNSANLIGLLLMSVGRNEEAIPYFKQAIRLIPVDNPDDSLSMHYHATGNLGECYLKLNLPDSALTYSLISLLEAEKRGRIRGVALANLNMAEASILLKDYHKAKAISIKSYQEISTTKHHDVSQLFCSILMRIYQEQNQPDSVVHWIKLGLQENERPENTDFSRVLFLKQCFATQLDLGNTKEAEQLLQTLYTFENNLKEKQQSQRIAVLQDYYEQVNSLALAKEEAKTRESALHSRTIVLFGLILVAVLLGILLYSVRKNARQKERIATLQHQKEMQDSERKLEVEAIRLKIEALHHERDRIAADLHDDIGAALSSIRIYGSAAQQLFEKEPNESKKLLSQITEGSAGMMDRMSDIVWSINPKNDSGESLLFRMKSFASELLSRTSIRISYQFDESIERLFFSAEARKNTYLIFKEAINNCSKYSDATEVLVDLFIEQTQLVLRIRDNGNGFDLAAKRNGNGLRNMNKRAEQMGGHFAVNSEINKGTSIEVTLSLAKISDTSNG